MIRTAQFETATIAGKSYGRVAPSACEKGRPTGPGDFGKAVYPSIPTPAAEGQSVGRPASYRAATEMNQPRPEVIFREPSDFVNGVADWVESGGGIVPIIGPGLSIPAGIPAVSGLKAYLQDCVVRSVAHLWKLVAEQAGLAESRREERHWNPHHDPWPNLRPSAVEAAELAERIAKFRDRYRDLLGKLPSPAIDPRSREAKARSALAEAHGALADLRSCLVFLSRLEPLSGSDPWLGGPKGWIVDQLARHVVADHAPALEHRMLANLHDPLRVRVSLTTNYDDLYERALAEFGLPLTPFGVHRQDDVLATELARGMGPLLVKIHGGGHGFRADYALADPPGVDDRRMFASYVAGASIPPKAWEYLHHPTEIDKRTGTALGVPPDVDLAFRQDTSILRSLFVCGVGANDPRILRLLVSATKRLRSRPQYAKDLGPLQVFWVAYGWQDVGLVKKTFERYGELAAAVTVTQERHLGLLLLELYQRLTGVVPPAALEFPSMWRISTPPEPYYADKDWYQTGRLPPVAPGTDADSIAGAVMKGAEDLSRAIKQAANPPDGTVGGPRGDDLRLVLVTSATYDADTCDVVSAVSYAYQTEVEHNKTCIWLELDQIANADELFERVLQAMGKRIGDERHPVTRATDQPFVHGQPLPTVSDVQRRDDRRVEFYQMTNGLAADWRIFLHGTEGFGTSLDFNPFSPKRMGDAVDGFPARDGGPSRESSWALESPTGLDDSRDFKGLTEVLSLLAGPVEWPGGGRAAGATVVLTLEEQGDGPAARILAALCERWPKLEDSRVTVGRRGIGVSVGSIVEKGWPGLKSKSDQPRGLNARTGDRSREFRQFVYMQTSGEVPRFPAGLVLWPIRPEDDPRRFDGQRDPALRDVSEKWLEKALHHIRTMVEFGWARRKSGGFAWMHNAVKDELRQRLAAEFVPRDAGGRWLDVDIHQSLADWYWKLFVSSGNPPSLFESVKHRLACARAAMGCVDWKFLDKRNRLLSGLLETAMALNVGRGALVSRGYTAASCDRLERIDGALSELLRLLEEGRVPAECAKLPGLRDAVRTSQFHARYDLFRLALEVVDARKIPARLERYLAVPGPGRGRERSTPKAAAVKQSLEAALAQINARTYNLAASSIKTAIESLSVPRLKVRLPILAESREIRAWGVREARDAGGKCGAALAQTADGVELAVRAYRRSLLLELQRCEVERASNRYVRWDHAPPPAQKEHPFYERLKRAVLTYHFASELTRFLPNGAKDRLFRERIALKQLYGAILSIWGEHTEADQRFGEAYAMAAFDTSHPRQLYDGITGILQAEAKLRRVYQDGRNGGFADRFNYLNECWRATESVPAPIDLSDGEGDRVLAWLRDAGAVLDRVRKHSVGRRKDAWWGNRYLFARIRVEAFRCITLAGTGHHERLLESRGAGLPSAILLMADLLGQMGRVMRTDAFIVARGCQQCFTAITALARWHGDRPDGEGRRMPEYLRIRLDREVEILQETIRRVVAAVQSVRQAAADAPDPVVNDYVDWAIKRLTRFTVKTVLVLDMVGYSDRARDLQQGLNSAKAVADLNKQIQGFVDVALNAVGRLREESVVATTGDGAILVFEAAADAYRFAEALHRVTTDHNARLVGAARREFRTGAATGNIEASPNTTGGIDVAGVAVSDAVRLETASDAGHLLVDEETFVALPLGARKHFERQPEQIDGKRDEKYTAYRRVFAGPKPAAPPESAGAGSVQPSPAAAAVPTAATKRPPNAGPKAAIKLLDSVDSLDTLIYLFALIQMPPDRQPISGDIRERRTAVFAWANGPGGCGLVDLVEALDYLIHKRSG